MCTFIITDITNISFSHHSSRLFKESQQKHGTQMNLFYFIINYHQNETWIWIVIVIKGYEELQKVGK